MRCARSANVAGAMQEAVPVGVAPWAALLNMSLEDVEASCAEAARSTGKIVVPANFNGPVRSSSPAHAEAVEAALEGRQGPGWAQDDEIAGQCPLPFTPHGTSQGPHGAHPSRSGLPGAQLPLVNNVDAAAVTDPAALRDGLARQIPGAVRWQATLELLLGQGVTTFLNLAQARCWPGW